MAIVPFKTAMAQVLKQPEIKKALAAARNLSKRGAKKQFKKKKARPGDLSRPKQRSK